MRNDDRADYREAYERCGVPAEARNSDDYFMVNGPDGWTLYAVPRQILYGGDGSPIGLDENGYFGPGPELAELLDGLHKQHPDNLNPQDASILLGSAALSSHPEMATLKETTLSAHASLGPKAVAQIFDVTERTVINWAQAGKLKSWRTPGRRWRFEPEVVEEFMRLYYSPSSANS